MSCAFTNLRVHLFHLYRSVCSRASDSFSSSSHTIFTIRFTQVITTINYMTFFREFEAVCVYSQRARCCFEEIFNILDIFRRVLKKICQVKLSV